MPASHEPVFDSSRLVSLLRDIAGGDVADSKRSLVERLGQWLGWTDAISISAVLNGSTARPWDASSADPLTADGAAAQVARVRAELAQAVGRDKLFAARAVAVQVAVPVDSADASGGTSDFSVYRRGYAAHQRAMEAALVPLRAQLRAVAAASSPRLARLAALDAVLEKVLGEQERVLWLTVQGLLDRRFRRLRRAFAESAVDGQEGADGWLPQACQEMQAVLLAELELRLQPLEGLLAALRASRPAGEDDEISEGIPPGEMPSLTE